MNIYDISKRAGVSIATVSRVINGSDKVSERTRQKVMAVIEEMNYTPNVFARGLGLNTMRTVGFLCPDASDPFISSAVYHAERLLKAYGYNALITFTGYDLADKEQDLQILLSKGVDAVLLLGSSHIEETDESNAYIRRAAAKVPVGIVNGWLDGDNIYCAFCDDYSASYEAVTYLLEGGCRDILYFYYGDSYSGRRKLKGYEQALRDFGIRPDPRRVIAVDRDMDDVKRSLEQLWQDRVPFDGIFCSQDKYAVAALKYAKARAIPVPEQLQIIGYNNSILSLATDPELTTVDSVVRITTEKTVRMLMDVLDGKEVEGRVSVPGILVKRETTR